MQLRVEIHEHSTWEKIKPYIFLLAAIAVVIVVSCLVFDACRPTLEQKQHIDAAYQKVLESIDDYATKLEQWYPSL